MSVGMHSRSDACMHAFSSDAGFVAVGQAEMPGCWKGRQQGRRVVLSCTEPSVGLTGPGFRRC